MAQARGIQKQMAQRPSSQIREIEMQHRGNMEVVMQLMVVHSAGGGNKLQMEMGSF